MVQLAQDLPQPTRARASVQRPSTGSAARAANGTNGVSHHGPRPAPAPITAPALAPTTATALAPTTAPAPAPTTAPALDERASVEDWLRIPEQKRAELIHGDIVYHAFPGVRHGNTQGRLSRLLHPYDRRRPAGGGGGGGGGAGQLGGWWISQEVDLFIAGVGCRPDVVGWRRDRHVRVPQPNAQGVITEAPDFICEVLSASTARYDQSEKRDAYFRAGVPHYWLVDPETSLVTLLERTERGYLIVRVAGPGEVVRAAPFDGVEIPVDELFLDEEGELPDAADATAAPPPAPTEPTAAARRKGASAPAAPTVRQAAKKKSPRAPRAAGSSASAAAAAPVTPAVPATPAKKRAARRPG